MEFVYSLERKDALPMARTWMTSALLAAALAWAAPALSWACSMEKPGEPCPCKQHQKAPEPKPEPAKSEHAAKCTCAGPADCTCKKGTCKCPKCGKRHEGRVIEQLRGERDALRLPANARSDASAGMFI